MAAKIIDISTLALARMLSSHAKQKAAKAPQKSHNDFGSNSWSIKIENFRRPGIHK